MKSIKSISYLVLVGQVCLTIGCIQGFKNPLVETNQSASVGTSSATGSLAVTGISPNATGTSPNTTGTSANATGQTVNINLPSSTNRISRLSIVGSINGADPNSQHDAASGYHQSDGYFRDVAIAGSSIAPATSVALESIGVFGSVENASASTNGVGGSFFARSNGDHANVWGANILATDGFPYAMKGNLALAKDISQGAYVQGIEVDTNVFSSTTHLRGVTVGGASGTQPADAFGYSVNNLGSGAKWDIAFMTAPGAAKVGIGLGPVGANIDPVNGTSFTDHFKVPSQSQPIQMTGLQEGTLRPVTSQIYTDTQGNLVLEASTQTGDKSVLLPTKRLVLGQDQQVSIGADFYGNVLHTSAPGRLIAFDNGLGNRTFNILPEGGVQISAKSTRSACDEGHRGTIYFLNGGTSDDQLLICMRVGGIYNWNTVTGLTRN